MKTLLIPVNFSGSSENIIQYAADFSCDTHVERIILLKSFYVSVYTQLLPDADFVQLSAEEIDAEKRAELEKLKVLGQQLLKKCLPTIKIKTVISDLPLLRAVHQVLADEQADVVMMGTDKALYENDPYISEQIIAIAKTSPRPVMIIPNHIRYKKMEEAVVPCDFAAISRLNAFKTYRDPAKWLHPKLLLLNVDAKHQHPEDDPKLTIGLKDLMEGYEYQVFYSEDKDTVHGILDFSRKHNPQLIIALPGKYSFFYNLTHRSITKALTLNSDRPVLILK
ncbi:universal stress protein [Mucilaginibacter gotjawali]|uniref:Nucleotide-binding universal stress UspA family protein n=1 Tax=Mucilaginibacter gotjawali TaxID=1550579 RepID=A0A839S9Z2_9SPHI|nr:universal stress protein [Mucilaginibacter gotjawali]MBB3054438.1 nucleotide-binding universal stress UspA family protein [Mucilaginibacter gotjawali]